MSDGGAHDGGFELIHMVQAQRGMSDSEIEMFLATGVKPDLSLPPPEERQDMSDGDLVIITEEAAHAWLSGRTLTAGAFLDFDSHHGVSPHYEHFAANDAFRFDPKQPRDGDGKWTRNPLGKLADLAKSASKLGQGSKKSTPATIYKKHSDGTIISQSKTGDKRMRWDADEKKFIVEKHQNDQWTHESSLAKGAAYNELKKPDAWYEPAEVSNVDASVPTRTVSTQAPSASPELTTSPTVSNATKLKPSAIYGKYNDGDTVAQSADGSQRMTWDAGRKKFVVEREKDGDWVEDSVLTKGAAYNDVKNSDKWYQPNESGQTSAVDEPSSPPQTPEPNPVDTDTTVPTDDVVVDPSQLDDTSSSVDTTDPIAKMRAAYDGGFTVLKEFHAGNVAASVELLELSDGSQVVRKKSKPSEATNEFLAGRIANALGIDDVITVQLDDEHVITTYIEGDTGSRRIVNEIKKQKSAAGKISYAKGESIAKKVVKAELKAHANMPGGREIGLLDWLTANHDRHDLNWIITPDGKVKPIDHGNAHFRNTVIDLFEGGTGEVLNDSPFLMNALGTKASNGILQSINPKFTKAELNGIKSGLLALEFDFADRNAMDKFDYMISQIDRVIAGAKK